MSIRVLLPKVHSRFGHYAGFISRLVAFVIDTIIISTTLLFATWFVETTLQPEQFGAIFRVVIQRIPILTKIIGVIFSPGMTAILSLIFVVTYYVFFWYTAGQTPGKAILGIKIVPLSGIKLTLAQAFLRYLTYYLSGLMLGLGFLWIIIDDRRMAWHDRLSGTCVIYAWDARPDESFLAPALQAITNQRIARQHKARLRFAEKGEKSYSQKGVELNQSDPSLQDLPEVER